MCKEPRSKAGQVRQGFTLMELLVVIGIIMLLMGILFPALTKARDTARRTKAKADVKQLDIAFKAIAADSHGDWSAAGIGPAESGRDMDRSAIDYLTGSNPKGAVYMEFDRGSTNASGFVDPWQTPYHVAMGTDSVSPAGAPNLPRMVAAWSSGPDRVSGNKDDVKSWE